jgi:YVTN family beta-propeller protein
MDVRLLGAIEAGEDGISLPLGGARQRAVLADLALHAGHVVSTGQLAEDLWGDRPPATAKRTLESYVYRLRQIMGTSGASGTPLVTRPTGYLLDIAPDRVDVWQFRDLAARGSSAMEQGDATTAVTLLRTAMGLCRGPALADIQDAAFAPTAAQRLEEERLTMVENLVEARLALGQHRELVPELETLIENSPYRERFHAQLMLALYRSDRQADALAAYTRARALLAGELGIEPGRELRELHRAVLLQAPELEPPNEGAARRAGGPSAAPGAEAQLADRRPSAPAGPRATGPVVPGGRRTWRWVVAAGAVALAAAVIVPVVLATGPAHGSLLADGVGEVTAAGGVTRTLALPDPPGAAVAADGSVWAVSPEGNVVYRINPATASLIQTIPVRGGPSAITASGPDIWVANTLDGTISRISAATNQVVQTIGVGTEPTGITAGGGAIWVAEAAASTVSALSPVSGKPIATVALAAAPFGVAYGAGSVWVTSPGTDSVTRVDPRSRQPGQQILVGAGPTAIAFGLGSVWVANSLDSTVSRVDPVSDAVTATIPVGDGPDALAVTGGSVWAADRLSGSLSRIGARGGAGVLVSVGGSPVGLAALTGSSGSDGLWVAAGPPARSPPTGGTLRVVSNTTPASIDPALIYPVYLANFSAFTYDTLVTFQKAAGASGLQIVPDLALAMPAVTRSGTVYTFTLRPGLRYSDGRPVRPADFRLAIERVLSLNSPAAAFLQGIMGASACGEGKPCDLASGISVDDSANTVTFRLTAPDPYFLDKLAFEFTAPVPAYVPADRASQRPVPGTGPYMITKYVPGHLVVFTRNPYFREWSAAAQPAGAPDRITWTFGLPVAREAADIEDGKADWTNDQLPNVAALAARFPSQVHINPLPSIVFTAFNTRVAPFNDPQVRRAFSLAADRRRFVALLGGPDQAVPACQILPPGIPGYRPYCPFSADPGPSGTWTGPNLALARKLVAASGTHGMRVTLLVASWDPQIGRFAVSVLRELGYRAVMRLASQSVVANDTNNSRARIQATTSEWFADYPSASDFLDLFFRCSDFSLTNPAATRNGAFFCDPAADRLMNLADREESTDPQTANTTWARVDRVVTHAAPWVVLANLTNVDFLSTRVTNYQYSPFLGMLLDQLQIHPRLLSG